MKNIFGIDNPLFVFIGKAVDILLLSILWLVLSLPVVTIGAASTALYYTMIKNVRRERGMLLKEFFCSFKLNFKQSTIMTLVLIGYLFLAWICIPFARQLDTGTLIDDIYHVVSGGGYCLFLSALCFPGCFPYYHALIPIYRT